MPWPMAPRVLDSRHGAEWYYRLLRDEGAIVNIWRTTYFHQLPGGAAAIVEWFKGSGLENCINFLHCHQVGFSQHLWRNFGPLDGREWPERFRQIGNW